MPRVLLLLPTTTYRTKAFVDAALKLRVDVVAASEQPSTLEKQNPEELLTLEFSNPEVAARQAEEYAANYPIDAIIPVDEDTAVVAALVAEVLNLEHNPVEATITAKNKYHMREVLNSHGMKVPSFVLMSLDQDPGTLADRIDYPCVVKPVFLSTSRGVMRANNQIELEAALKRLDRIVSEPKIARRGGTLARKALVERFIPGFEVAVEGLITAGQFRPLAIFDKPDRLDGPFFEETIYVTPSRLERAVLRKVVETTAQATRAMGLIKGPVHAELRVNEAGAWIIEVAARAIGGLCSRALKFDGDVSLEEVIIRNAIGENTSSIQRESLASGVMMIPIPRAGVLREVLGLAAAKNVPCVEDIVISAHITQKIEPPPEGATYLGFIFSRADTPDQVEQALRESHSRLEFVID
ncbi:MAG TPA: ATP-grasp domain-containing protein [Blastocatellia bacterium]|nr:ATP-grasp domain-containing protein [Blastocatellia bacterium]